MIFLGNIMKFEGAFFEDSIELIGINSMYQEYSNNFNMLQESLQNGTSTLSFVSAYRQLHVKVFLVASANSFERCFLKKIPNILGFDTDSTHETFIQKQALDRKYHTLFSWDKSNANSFFALFGRQFKEHMEIYRKNNYDFKTYEQSFLKLGNYRNLIVHEGITLYSCQLELDECNKLFKESIEFCKETFDQLCIFNLTN